MIFLQQGDEKEKQTKFSALLRMAQRPFHAQKNIDFLFASSQLKVFLLKTISQLCKTIPTVKDIRQESLHIWSAKLQMINNESCNV